MKIAVSACLLGEEVRFDKGHKRDRFITDELSRYFEFVPFCPENLAFGSPRPSMRVVKINESNTIRSNKTGEDLTQALSVASTSELEKIKDAQIGAIIFKSKSPSCGLGSAKLYLENGFSDGSTDGLFARLCTQAFHLLPMEEEGRLNDPWLRENFVMQLFAYEAFELFKAKENHMKDLVLFHQKNKFLLQSKNDVIYRQLGNIVANHEKKPFETLLDEYEDLYKSAISQKSSTGKTRNVLEHMAGFVKEFLDSAEKAMLHEQIEDYAHKIIPVIVPLSTLMLYASKYEVTYLLEQTFLNPYPKELALRSNIKSIK